MHRHRHTYYTDAESQRITRPAVGLGRGPLLFTAKPNRRRICLEILLRLALSAFALLSTLAATDEFLIPTAAVLLIFSLWPLLHWGDQIDFFQNGLVYLGRFYPLEANALVTWVGRWAGLLPSTYLHIDRYGEEINITYMHDAQKLFNRAYYHTEY